MMMMMMILMMMTMTTMKMMYDDDDAVDKVEEDHDNAGNSRTRLISRTTKRY